MIFDLRLLMQIPMFLWKLLELGWSRKFGEMQHQDCVARDSMAVCYKMKRAWTSTLHLVSKEPPSPLYLNMQWSHTPDGCGTLLHFRYIKILEVFRDGNVSYAYSCMLNLISFLHRISYNNKNKLFWWFLQVVQRFFFQSVLIETCWILNYIWKRKGMLEPGLRIPCF